MQKKLIALLLSAVLIFSCFPLCVSAETGDYDTIVISSMQDVHEKACSVMEMGGKEFYVLGGNVEFSGAESIVLDAQIYVVGERVTIDSGVTLELAGELRSEIGWSDLVVNGCLKSHGAIDLNMWSIRGSGSIFESWNLADMAYLAGENYADRFDIDMDIDCAAEFCDEEWIRPMLESLSESDPVYYRGLCMCFQYDLFDGMNVSEMHPFDTLNSNQIKDYLTRLATLLSQDNDDALAKINGIIAAMPENTEWFAVFVHEEEDYTWTESTFRNYISDFQAAVPRKAIDCTEIKVRFEETDGGYLLKNDLNDGDAISGFSFKDPLTIRVVGDTPDYVSEYLEFFNCDFQGEVTVICKPQVELGLRFNGCEYGAAGSLRLMCEESIRLIDYMNCVTRVESFNGAMPAITSELPVLVESYAGGATLNGVTVEPANEAERTSVSFDISCLADHEFFDWERNDHSECGGELENVLRINPDRMHDEFIVSGICEGVVSRVETYGNIGFVQADTFGKDTGVYLYDSGEYWNDKNQCWEKAVSDVRLNGNAVIVDTDGIFNIISKGGTVEVRAPFADVTVNGIGKPHIFDERGIFIGTGTMPQDISVSNYDEVLYPEDYEVELSTENGETPTAENPASKVHLYLQRGEETFGYNRVRLSFRIDGTTYVYDPVYSKQITYEQMAEMIRQRSGYEVDISAYNAGEEITVRDALNLLCQLWSTFDAPERFPGSEIRPSWCSEDSLIDDSTAMQMIKSTMEAMGMDSVEVHNADELRAAVNNNWEKIKVASDFALADDEYTYFDFWIYNGTTLSIEPGVTLTLGSENGNVGLKIDNEAELVIEVDPNDPNRHGKIEALGDSEIEIYGHINDNGIPRKNWLLSESDYTLVVYQRVGAVAQRLYETLTESNETRDAIIPELTESEIAAHIGEAGWPDAGDIGTCKGMAFLVKYLDLQPEYDDYGQPYWPTWNLVNYGEVRDTLSALWEKLAEIDGKDMGALPDWVRLPWYKSDWDCVSYDELGMLLGRFVDAYLGNYYTVHFVDFDGTELSSQAIVPGFMELEWPDDPFRCGYEFIGWDTDLGTITGETTVTAQYRRVTPASLEQFDYSVEDGGIVINRYFDYDWQVIINDYYTVRGKKLPVVKIEECAFDSNFSIRYVSIPETVEVIGDYAFYNCTSLEKVVVNNPQTALGEGVFGYYYITKKQDGIDHGMVVTGYEGSTAQKYAQDTELVFESLNPTSIAGDVDQDGKLDSTDAVALKQMLLSGRVEASGDTNGDGTVDIRDLVRLKKLLA